MVINRKHITAGCIGGIALIALTATASALITRKSVDKEPVVAEEKISHTTTHKTNERVAVTQPSPAPQPVASACNDGNIAGTVIGGAAGGVVGSQIGSGSGQTAATIAGVAGGALLGREYIPTHNVTCP